ncbi:MAG: hypothetical protein ACOVNY_01245 [Chitinophagaceae bacterium]
MDIFLPHTDSLGLLIQNECTKLYALMKTLSVKDLGLSKHGEQYFLGSHFKRLFFSIQTSAHLLYNSISLTKKKVTDIVIMDYGAGIGSLYLLAKMIGCKEVIYNDILEEWKQNALQIAKALQKDVDRYIVGDIATTLEQLQTLHIECDIIVSRNVIEHIYELDTFYKIVDSYQPKTLVYSSTTANFRNPAMNLQHVLLNNKLEKIFLQQRFSYIQQLQPQLTDSIVQKLAIKTRGYEKSDIEKAVTAFVQTGITPAKRYIYTNTCDMNYGVWAENLLPFSIHKQMVAASGRKALIVPGFWDTHYSSKLKNVMARFFNTIIKSNKFCGFLLAPFIYVIALPKNYQ